MIIDVGPPQCPLDLYTLAAAVNYGVKYSEVTPLQRNYAKNAAFVYAYTRPRRSPRKDIKDALSQP